MREGTPPAEVPTTGAEDAGTAEGAETDRPVHGSSGVGSGRGRTEGVALDPRAAALLDHLTETVFLVAPTGEATLRLGPSVGPLGFGLYEEDGGPVHVAERVHPDDLVAVLGLIEEVRATPGLRTAVRVRARHKDGTWRLLEAGIAATDDPDLEGALLRIRDVTSAHEAADDVGDRFRSLAHAVPSGILCADARGSVVFSNELARELLALDEARLLGRGWEAAVEAEDRTDVVAAARAVLAGSAIEEVTFRVRGASGPRWLHARFVPLHGDRGGAAPGDADRDAGSADRDSGAAGTGVADRDPGDVDRVARAAGTSVADRDSCAAETGVADRDSGATGTGVADREVQAAGTRVVDRDSGDVGSVAAGPVLGRPTGWLAALDDITERRRYESQLAHRATHDPLTDLPNRTLLDDRLAQACARLGRDGEQVAVLFCDLDDFKEVNDRFDHTVGDRVLVEVGRRIRGVLRPADTVGRLGGDEFVVVCERTSAAEADDVAARIRLALAEPFAVAGGRGLDVSIGIAAAVDATAEAGDLLLRADQAMYRRKHERRAPPA